MHASRGPAARRARTAALGAGAMVAMEGGGDALVQRGIGEKVAGNLLDGELIERHVAIERVDDPVAPPPHFTDAVGLIPIGIAIARCFHPAEGHALGISRRRQQPVDDFLVRARGFVVQERMHFDRRGRQTGQIERDTPDQRAPVGFGRMLQPLVLQTFEHKSVDRIAHPILFAHLRKRRLLRRNKRPVALPRRTLFNPAANQADLTIRQLVATHISRRHAQRGIIRSHTPVDFAVLRVACDYGFAAIAQVDLRAVFRVKSQFAFTIRGIGAVAGVALVGEDGANVAVELDSAVVGSRTRQEQHAGKHGG